MREEAIQTQAADYLDRFLPDDALFWHTPNGGLRNKIVAAKLKAQGVKPGVPDICILWRGHLTFVEIKPPGGYASDAQRAFRDRATAQGVGWYLCRSLDQVAEVCEQLYPMKARLARSVARRDDQPKREGAT